ncbi:MAG: DUF3604 domain-containing protein [Gammaproteobacteria bacterium]|nr:DUF3604 domain-containing protein [Gammaproteobacteria bacterium]
MTGALVALAVAASFFTIQAGAEPPVRNVYFGDLHVHTKYSADAYRFGARTGPDAAYAYAKGAPLRHPAGQTIRMRGAPLDFLAVTDHAEYLGNVAAVDDPANPMSDSELAEAYSFFNRAINAGELDPGLWQESIRRDAWQRTIEAAERHYAPGRFTTFVGYEYTSAPDGMLHRNVIFKGARVPELPFGAYDSLNPEDLWAWLERLRAQGIEALAIPHNPNSSRGNFFLTTTFAGEPMDAAYAEIRMRNEPIVEMTQIKGTSETHPLLSPNDEWANFEVRDRSIDEIKGSYVRDALLTGFELQHNQGFNPYRFGFIGSSDTHNTGAAYEESAYHGKIGILDGLPKWRFAIPNEDNPELNRLPGITTTGFDWSASGLAAVWAEANTREAIYAALRRKETFATSGTRLRVKFFAGYDLDASRLYATGVPMGGDLEARPSGSGTPRFFAWALRDPSSAWLQRLQIVKGWLDDGVRQERVYDVACSDGLEPNPDNHRCPDNGASVDLATCDFDFDKGDVELKAMWEDPDFDPDERAFYYVRALENPTCRWSTWDANRLGLPLRAEKEPTLQERAWTSPIWILPRAGM